MEQTLTEGARRVLDLASRLAANAHSSQVEPLHLLWGLLLEESRASEIMQERGLTSDTLQAVWPFDSPVGEIIGLPAADGGAKTLPLAELVRQAMFEAQRQVALAGRHAALGTEHILYGLVSGESDAAEILQRYNLTRDSLSPVVTESSGFSQEPILLEESIRWRDQTETQQTDVLRILDAAANRAREGLRVLEDYMRFTLDDAHLTQLLKDCRHALAGALLSVENGRLIAARDTRNDVGTAISTPTESLRTSSLDVLKANFKRVQESLRTLEEFGKIIAPRLGENMQQLRYDLYSLEKAVLQTEQGIERFAGRNLYLLATEALCHHGSGPAIRESLAAGVSIVQIREKEMPDRKLLDHCLRVREWTRAAGALLIVNDRPDLAVLADADGVHVGQDELGVREARRIVGPDRLIGVSTHSIEQARSAVLDGADYLGVGPVFASSTKQIDRIAGLEFVKQVAAEIRLPWFAIGGITAKNVAQVVAAGATRVAVSSAICSAEKPDEAAAELLKALVPR